MATKPEDRFPPAGPTYEFGIAQAENADKVRKLLDRAANDKDVDAAAIGLIEAAAQLRLSQLAFPAAAPAPAVQDQMRQDAKVAKETGEWTVRDLSTHLNIPPGFLLTLNGKPYVTKEGLLLQARRIGYDSISATLAPIDGDPAKGWEAEARIVRSFRPQDYDLLVKVKDVDAAAFRELWRDLRQPTVAHATATRENVTMATMHRYMRELAETRAINRALRLFTGCGLATPDELPEYQTREA
jgi:hypothetical protein